MKKPKTILIIEPDANIRSSLNLLFQFLEKSSLPVKDISEAREILKALIPDVVILDINGLIEIERETQFIDFVKKLSCRPKIIIMSTNKNMGAKFPDTIFLNKPFQIHDLEKEL